jgi:hypothetical protein
MASFLISPYCLNSLTISFAQEAQYIVSQHEQITTSPLRGMLSRHFAHRMTCVGSSILVTMSKIRRMYLRHGRLMKRELGAASRLANPISLATHSTQKVPSHPQPHRISVSSVLPGSAPHISHRPLGLLLLHIMFPP